MFRQYEGGVKSSLSGTEIKTGIESNLANDHHSLSTKNWTTKLECGRVSIQGNDRPKRPKWVTTDDVIESSYECAGASGPCKDLGRMDEFQNSV